MKYLIQTLLISSILCSLAIAQDAEQLWCEYPAPEGIENGKHIVLIAGDDEYRSEEAMPMLGKLLSQRHGFRCTVLFPINPKDGTIKPDHQTNIPGMEALGSADLVILGLRFRNLPDEQMEHFDNYLKAGKPFIGLRTSTHAFNYPDDSESKYKHYHWRSRDWRGGFGQQVLGETWISHHGQHKRQSTGGVINEAFADHPILRGVKDVWGPTDVYGVRNLPETANVLMHGAVLEGMSPDDKPVESEKNDPMMPLVWTKEYENDNGKVNRVVCTTMGSSNDLSNDGLRRLVVNSCFWILDMGEQITDDLSIETVGEYKPTMYGFNIYAEGMRPSDYNLKKE